MSRVPTLKLTDEKFDEILKSDRAIETLMDYKISPEEAQKYGRKLLEMIKSHLITDLKISKNTQELIDFYNNVVSKEYFTICEYEKCKTIPQAIEFFRKKTNKSYDSKDVIDFYKYQFNETLKDYISSYEDLLNKIGENNMINDEDLQNLSGGTSWAKRWISGAILGLTLPTSVNFTSIARERYPKDMSMQQVTKQLKNNLKNIKTLNKAPTDFFIPKTAGDKQKKKNWFDRLPWWAKDGIAVLGGSVINSLLSGKGWLESFGEFIETPKKVSEFKNFWPRTQENVKGAVETVSDLLNGSNEKEMKSLGADKKRQGNYFASMLTSEIFGQEEAISDIVDYCISPFIRHLAMSANEAVANNKLLGPNMLEDRVRNPLINISVLFGPAGVGKTETYKVIKDKIFMGQIPNALIQVSEFANSDKSFKDWLWERKDWDDLLNGVRRDKQCMILFDEFDKLPDSKRKDICEFLRSVYDNGELPAKGEFGPIPLNRAMIFLATNEVNPRQKKQNVGSADFERPEDYKTEKYWDSSFMSRVSAFIDYKKLTPCAFSEILSGELRKIRKAYWMTERVNIDLARDFSYWGVTSVSDKSRLDNGARLVKTKFTSLINTEIDKQLTKVKESITKAGDKINPKNLQVELKWVSKKVFIKRTNRLPGETITLPGDRTEYAPLLVVKTVSTPDLKLNWKKLDTICNVIDDWRNWGMKQCYETEKDPTGVNSLHDRLIYRVYEAFRNKRDPRKVIKETVDRWIDKVSNGIFEYKLYVQVLQDLHLPCSDNPLTKQLEIIKDDKDIDGPSFDKLKDVPAEENKIAAPNAHADNEENKPDEDGQKVKKIELETPKDPGEAAPAPGDDKEKENKPDENGQKVKKIELETPEDPGEAAPAPGDDKEKENKPDEDGQKVKKIELETPKDPGEAAPAPGDDKEKENKPDENGQKVKKIELETPENPGDAAPAPGDDKEKENKPDENDQKVNSEELKTPEGDPNKTSVPQDTVTKQKNKNIKQMYEEINNEISGRTANDNQKEKDTTKPNSETEKPKSTDKDYKSYLKWDKNKSFEQNVEDNTYKEEIDPSR